MKWSLRKKRYLIRGYTGERNEVSGIYDHFCAKNSYEKIGIALSEDERFPPCRDCGKASWGLREAA